MNRLILGGTLLGLAVQAAAGGFENARLDTAFMYDEGNLVSFGTVRKDFSVTGDTYATDKSAVGARNAANLSAKYQINDKLSIGLSSYDSGAIKLNYQGTGWSSARSNPTTGSAPLVDAFGPKVDLTSDSIALMARYSFSDSLSLIAGLRHDKFEVNQADIFGVAIFNYVAQTLAQGKAAGLTAASNRTAPTIQSASNTTPIIAVAYEKPEIALRVELLYQGESQVSMASTCGMGAGFCATDQSTGGMPDYLTLNFQSGIAEDTLLFGSIHRAKWTRSQFSVADSEQGPQEGPTSSFRDSTEYSLGLGRKLSDNWSVSASYNWEPKGESETDSTFTVNNGYKGVSLGARYKVDNLELSAGYNHTKLGDILYEGTASDNLMSGNSVNAFGARVKLKF